MSEQNGELLKRVAELEQQVSVLRLKSQHFAALANNIDAVLWITSADSRQILYVNDAYEKLWGRSCQSLYDTPKSWLEAVHSEDKPALVAAIQRRARNEINGATAKEYRIVRPDGQVRWISSRMFPVINTDGQVVQLAGISEDVTDRRLTEQALRDSKDQLRLANDELDERVLKRTAELALSEERWHSLVELAPDLIVMTDLDGRIRYINRVEQGFTVDDVIGTSSFDYVRPEYREALQDCHKSIIRTGQFASIELAVDLPDGRVVWYASRMGPLRDRRQIVGATSIATDISERKQAEVALVESEQRFRATFEQAAVGMAQVAPDGRFLRVNRTLCKIVGYSREELLICAFQDITHPEDLDADLHYLQQVLNGDIATYSMEKRYYRKDRSIVWINLTVALVRDTSGTPQYFISVVEDIDQRKQAQKKLGTEEQLLRKLLDLQEKERRLVAHDIHDGFMQDVVGAYFHLQAVHGALDSDTVESKIEQVGSLLQKAIEEGRRLIRDLRPMGLDEGGVVEAIEHLIADEQKHAGLVVTFQHAVQFNRLESRLEGAIFRIVQEALTNVKHHAQTKHAAVQLTQRNNTLHIVVRDQGLGFDPSTVSLERFGLRGIRERARLFGGEARIESTTGEGTTVVVHLPLKMEN